MMPRHKHDQILAGQISSVRKVYAVVPIAEAWTIAQIIGELARTGIKQDTHHVDGCVKTLVEAGLVKLDSTRRAYQRIYCFPEVKQEAAAPGELAHNKEPSPMSAAPAPKKIDPLTKLTQHAGFLRNLADDIDEAVLEAMAQLEAAKSEGGAELARIRGALQTLGFKPQ